MCKQTMQKSKPVIKKQRRTKNRGCNRVLCCTCRLSVSSEEEAESLNNSSSESYPVISSIAHAMVQERLDQMIRERQEARDEDRRMIRRGLSLSRREETKFVVVVAMEKSSHDPREDFRESMMQMIVENRIHEVKDLRRLLNYYVTMNAEEFRGVILEVFHDVCTDLFLHCRRY